MAAETSVILSLPFIMPSQVQKHVTHNEALETLDAVVQLSVSGTAASPPLSPAAGERWIVAPAPDDAFAGHQGEIAVLRDGAWAFVQPLPGWTAYDRASSRILAHDGAAWAEVQPPAALAGLESVGINAAADAENRLAVASPTSLFTHEGAGHRLKVNKAAEAETASLLFQSAYEGRAEMGLAGNDDFAVKISADGAEWHEAISVERATGRVRFPSGGDVRTSMAAPSRILVCKFGTPDANVVLFANISEFRVYKIVGENISLDNYNLTFRRYGVKKEFSYFSCQIR
jgi:hypothetical protein